MTTAHGDRALHDALIRLLADAPFRDALHGDGDRAPASDLAPEHRAVLRSVDPERVRRFARFLARQYYAERIVHFHRYSRALTRWTGRAPEAVLRTPEFEALLPSVVLGSRDTAERVAALLADYLGAAPHLPPYAEELVRYQNAQLVVEAGPRVWRSDDEEPAPFTAESAPVRERGALVLHLTWDIPALLPTLLTAPAAERPPDARRAGVALLVARSPRARVSVLRCSRALLDFLERLDGTATIAAAADAARLPVSDAVEIAHTLREAGALRAPHASAPTT
ncbi:MAG: hypothetical protein IRY91_11710 [Gemmatimonadaceae bacterium]|nr:hypothetical protein [Gemmatimonadaceae bacterium]